MQERWNKYEMELPATAYWDIQHGGLECWAILAFAASEVRLAMQPRDEELDRLRAEVAMYRGMYESLREQLLANQHDAYEESESKKGKNPGPPPPSIT
jgi:hypothetical protein